jgi:hypothetical protein
MTSMMGPLARRLGPHARAAGYVRTERACWNDLDWLEFRSADGSGSILLSVFHIPSSRTVTVELWRPEQLRSAITAGQPERVLERHEAWRYPAQADLGEVGREVASSIVGWLDQLDLKHTPAPSDQRLRARQ